MNTTYICKDCGAVFEEARLVKETHGFNDGFAETEHVCPECGGCNFAEAVDCDECGRMTAIDELVDVDGRSVCPDCADDIIPDMLEEENQEAVNYRRAEGARFKYYENAGCKPIIEYPAAHSAYNMEHCAHWDQIQDILHDIITNSKDDWYAVAQHDPTYKAPAEQMWDSWIAQAVLDTGVCPGQLREMLGTMLLRYVWTHAVDATILKNVSVEAYHICPRLRLPHIAMYNDMKNYCSTDQLKNDLIGLTESIAMQDPGEQSMTGIQVDDVYVNMPTAAFCEMLEIKANETAACYVSDEMSMADRKRFVKNLGSLLSQTREGIQAAYLDNTEHVHVVYKNTEEVVNVRCDSYTAIIRDVAKAIKL